MGLEIYSYYFQHDTPDLAKGVPFYKPAPNDLLLDAWIEIDTAWDSAEAFCDIGRFIDGYTYGWWAGMGGNLPSLVIADAEEIFLDKGVLTAQQSGHVNTLTNFPAPLLLSYAFLQANLFIPAAAPPPSGGAYTAGFPLNLLTRILPAKFTTDDAVKVVVSQTGHNNGDDTGASQGAATVYLLVFSNPTPLARIDKKE